VAAPWPSCLVRWNKLSVTATTRPQGLATSAGIGDASGMQPGIVPMGSQALVAQQYLVRRSYWSFLGRTTRVFAPDGRLVCFIKAKLMSWRAETTLYADEGQSQPMMVMKARQVVGFRINHDIFDAVSGGRIGSVRNRGVGFFRDAWDVLDGNDQQVGEMLETGSAFMRRVLPILRNGRWEIRSGGQVVASIRERWTLFSKKYDLDLSHAQGQIHPHFAMACAILCLNRESARETR
jgi:hypothetical protein